MNHFKILLNSAVGRDVCVMRVWHEDYCLLGYLDVASFQRSSLLLSSGYPKHVGCKSIRNTGTYLSGTRCRPSHENLKFRKVEYTYRMN
jgi:hypothetical protein